MATQNCPRCKSDRIRLGYRTTSLFQKLIFRYNLLCNDCNWEFIGFAVPGTVSVKVKRKQKPSPALADSQGANNQLDVHDVEESAVVARSSTPARADEEILVVNHPESGKNRVKKRVRIKLT